MRKKTGRKSEHGFALRPIRNMPGPFGRRGPGPWAVCPARRTGLDPHALAAVLVQKTNGGCTYRKASGVLSASPDILRMLGLEKAPSKSALHAALLRPGPEYVRKMIFAPRLLRQNCGGCGKYGGSMGTFRQKSGPVRRALARTVPICGAGKCAFTP